MKNLAKTLVLIIVTVSLGLVLIVAMAQEAEAAPRAAACYDYQSTYIGNNCWEVTRICDDLINQTNFVRTSTHCYGTAQ